MCSVSMEFHSSPSREDSRCSCHTLLTVNRGQHIGKEDIYYTDLHETFSNDKKDKYLFKKMLS